MKRLLQVIFFSITLLLMAGCAFTQLEPGTSYRTKVVVVEEIPNVDKDEILRRAKMWIAENGGSYKEIVDYSDNNMIVAKGNIEYPCKSVECFAKHDWRIWFMLKIEAKDSKVRITATRFELSWPPSYDSLGYHKGYRGEIRMEDDLNVAKSEVKKIIYRIINYIKTENRTKNDNW